MKLSFMTSKTKFDIYYKKIVQKLPDELQQNPCET